VAAVHVHVRNRATYQQHSYGDRADNKATPATRKHRASMRRAAARWSMLALDPLTSSVSISRLLSASSAIHPARPTNFVEGKKFRNYGDSRAGRTLETRTARASGA